MISDGETHESRESWGNVGVVICVLCWHVMRGSEATGLLVKVSAVGGTMDLKDGIGKTGWMEVESSPEDGKKGESSKKVTSANM